MQVKDVMTQKVISISPLTKVVEAAKLMDEKRIGALPVVDEKGNLVGILTESDFIGKYEAIPHGLTIPSLMGEWLHGTSLEDVLKAAKNKEVSIVMTANPYTVSSESSLTAAANLMLKHDIGRLPVVDKGRLVGIISKQDIIKAILI